MFPHPAKLSTKTILFKCKGKLICELNTHSYAVLLQNKREFGLRRETFLGSEYKYPLGITKVLK